MQTIESCSLSLFGTLRTKRLRLLVVSPCPMYVGQDKFRIASTFLHIVSGFSEIRIHHVVRGEVDWRGAGASCVGRIEQGHQFSVICLVETNGFVQTQDDASRCCHMAIFVDRGQSYGSRIQVVAVVADCIGIDIVLCEIARQLVIYRMITTLSGPAHATYGMYLFQDMRHTYPIDLSTFSKRQVRRTCTGYLIFIYMVIAVGVRTVRSLRHLRSIRHHRRSNRGTNIQPVLLTIGIEVWQGQGQV